jgi:hypothetical protein
MARAGVRVATAPYPILCYAMMSYPVLPLGSTAIGLEGCILSIVYCGQFYILFLEKRTISRRESINVLVESPFLLRTIYNKATECIGALLDIPRCSLQELIRLVTVQEAGHDMSRTRVRAATAPYPILSYAMLRYRILSCLLDPPQ